MKFSTLVVGFAACMLFIAPVSAANPIATVNVQEIMQKSTAGHSIKEQMESKQKTYQDEMTKKEKQFKAEQEELVKQRSVLKPDAFEKKVKEFRKKEASVQREVQTKKEELDNAFANALGQVQKAVYDIVSEMAKEKGYSVVMPTTQLLWADPTTDITKDVLAKLNETLPKVSVTFTPVSADKAE